MHVPLIAAAALLVAVFGTQRAALAEDSPGSAASEGSSSVDLVEPVGHIVKSQRLTASPATVKAEAEKDPEVAASPSQDLVKRQQKFEGALVKLDETIATLANEQLRVKRLLEEREQTLKAVHDSSAGSPIRTRGPQKLRALEQALRETDESIKTAARSYSAAVDGARTAARELLYGTDGWTATQAVLDGAKVAGGVVAGMAVGTVEGAYHDIVGLAQALSDPRGTYQAIRDQGNRPRLTDEQELKQRIERLSADAAREIEAVGAPYTTAYEDGKAAGQLVGAPLLAGKVLGLMGRLAKLSTLKLVNAVRQRGVGAAAGESAPVLSEPPRTAPPPPKASEPLTAPSQYSVADAHALIESSEGRTVVLREVKPVMKNGTEVLEETLRTNTGHAGAHVPLAGQDAEKLSRARPSVTKTTVFSNGRQAEQLLRDILNERQADLANLKPGTCCVTGPKVLADDEAIRVVNTTGRTARPKTTTIWTREVTYTIGRNTDGALHLLHFAPVAP